MAGILNKKERMLDFIITQQGRQQIADGRMRIEYATVTDLHTFYQSTGSHDPSVAEDASNRLFFEAAGQIQDLIVPELEAGFSMQPFRTNDFIVGGRKIASGTFKTGAVTIANDALTGSAVVTGSQTLLSTIAQNFQNLRILGTEDLFSDTTDFILGAHTASFVLSNNALDFSTFDGVEHIEGTNLLELKNFPSIFASERFAHLPNFKFLPPVNVRTSFDEDPAPLGNYPELMSTTPLFQTKQRMQDYLSQKQSLEFGFHDTSRENNLMCQLFELNNPDHQGIEKLSVIDMGEFGDDDPESPGIHVYSVGKIRKDNQGTHTFVNLFTVVFD